jgi:hypothetical protein
MKKYYIMLLVILSAATSCISEAEISAPETTENAGAISLQTKMTGSTSGDYKDGCLLLYLTEETTERIENGEMEEVAAEMFAGLEVSDFQKALRHAPKNTELARELGLHRWFVVYFDESMPVRSFAEASLCIADWSGIIIHLRETRSRAREKSPVSLIFFIFRSITPELQ